VPRRRQTLSQAQLNELLQAYSQSQDGLLRTRYQAVRLYALGYPVAEIIEITGSSVTSVNRWWQTYRAEGLAGLVDGRAGGNSAKLTPAQLRDLSHKLHAYTPAQLHPPREGLEPGQGWTVADLQYCIQQWYGVTYRSPASYINLFRRFGVSYQRKKETVDPAGKQNDLVAHVADS
jgi:transposase